jgi:hypothetical protein
MEHSYVHFEQYQLDKPAVGSNKFLLKTRGQTGRFPIPEPGRHLNRQRESELMREHTHLPAVVGFMRKHVAQHFRANRPRRSPAVSAKLLDAASSTAERFREHLRAASGALGQSRTGLRTWQNSKDG